MRLNNAPEKKADTLEMLRNYTVTLFKMLMKLEIILPASM